MNGSGDELGLGCIFQDLSAKLDPTCRTLPVRTTNALARQLAAAWPELQFGRLHGALRAVRADSVPSWGAGLAFQPGILRPAGSLSAAWASSTIGMSWRGLRRLPGLAARILTRGDAAALRDRGDAIAAAMVANQLGGAPGMRDPAESVLRGAIVLVAGADAAADSASLTRLLQAHAAAQIVVLGRSAHGPLARLARRAGVAVIPAASINPWPVITGATALHAPAEAEIAVLARLAGRTVWLAGGTALPDVDPAALAAAHLILGTRYVDPANGAGLSCEAFIDRLIEWRRLQRRVPAIACFVGISFWKRRRMADFAGGPVRFASTAQQAVSLAKAQAGGIAVWPSRAPKGLDEAAAAAGVKLFRVEDGFIRSRGLGADFIPPASVIIDQRGIYYDARQPSDLEMILSSQDFTSALLDQARRLMDLLIARRITKYNLGGGSQTIAFPPGRRRVLVPGQVANDLSVQAGGAGVAPGLALLAEVRRRNPDAFIVYKPHPDVEAGHRPGAVPDGALRRFADSIVRDVDMAGLIDMVEEIHTVTSLTGFEALLRGRKVVTYGRPFYAGWGLTTDIYPPPRRGRTLRLEELVAATLILYPHYIDPVTRLPCGPEHLVAQLDQAAHWRTGLLVGLRRGQGAFRKNWSRGFSRRTAKVA